MTGASYLGILSNRKLLFVGKLVVCYWRFFVCKFLRILEQLHILFRNFTQFLLSKFCFDLRILLLFILSVKGNVLVRDSFVFIFESNWWILENCIFLIIFSYWFILLCDHLIEIFKHWVLIFTILKWNYFFSICHKWW